MSKITQALEKAARERRQREQEHPTAGATPITVPLAAPDGVPASSVGEIQTAGAVEIDPHIVTASDSRSPITEQYRILRTNLQALRLRADAKTLVVTSAIQGEGKSVTAINLAFTLARQEHAKVVLVDADLRKSSIHRWLGLPAGTDGLSTALAHGGALNGSLVKLRSPALTVLCSGPAPEHPAELLESASLQRLLTVLKTQFDYIVIDTPPVLAVTDPRILASHADGVLFVVRAGKTQRRTIIQAQAMLDQAKAPVVGCVLTHVDHYQPGYYYRYRQQEPGQHATTSAQTPVR